MLANSRRERGRIQTKYGNIAPASIGGDPAPAAGARESGRRQISRRAGARLRLHRQDGSDRPGYINILAADKLMRAPRLYATFLLWMLSEFSSICPRSAISTSRSSCSSSTKRICCSPTRPRSCSTAIEQVVRLIRSKGVGVYFVTQNPLDVPDTVLGQLGNRIQHALRAFTPRDQKAVRAAAETFRQNTNFDTAEAIMQLGVGEALVSMLDAKGTPEIVDRALIAPPNARVGTITAEERQAAIDNSPLMGSTIRRWTANRPSRCCKSAPARAWKRRRQPDAAARDDDARRPSGSAAQGGVDRRRHPRQDRRHGRRIVQAHEPEAHVGGRTRGARGAAIRSALDRHADQPRGDAQRSRRDVAPTDYPRASCRPVAINQ